MNNSNYTELERKYWDVYQSLGAYFGDIDSLQEGYDNFFINSKEALAKNLPKLKDFIDTTELDIIEKEKFIRSNVNYRFDDNNLRPIDWLKNLIHLIEEHLKKN